MHIFKILYLSIYFTYHFAHGSCCKTWVCICPQFVVSLNNELFVRIIHSLERTKMASNIHVHVNGSKEMAWLPCWVPSSQQISCRRWIFDIHCRQVMKYASEDPPWLQSCGKQHQSKTSISVAPQKGLSREIVF